MAKFQNTPLDEIQFRRPEVIQWWGGMKADSIHPIIRESPFFDHTSKNGLLWDQAQNDARTWEVCTNREAFETRLKSMNGVEYLIVGEPQKDPEAPLGDSGIWVIRKQERRKRAGREDEVTLLGTYYVVGDNMYQAPSVFDIVDNHLLSAMTSLSKFINLATPLPLFTPALGYTYYPPTTSKPSAAAASQSMLAHSSRESSVAPAAQLPSQQSQSASTLDIGSQPASTTSAQRTDPRDEYALFESFNMMLRYGDEYMDENPLRGEPGNFTFTSTKDRVRAKQAEAEAVKAKEQELVKKLEDARAAAAATPFAVRPAPEKAQGVGGETKPVVRRSKTGTGERVKRRRSKIATSPTTPASPAVLSPAP